MTKSPFPGMDPYLEQDWLDAHARLITYICDQMQQQLPEDLLARMESRVLVSDVDDEEIRQQHPDVRVVDVGGQRGGGATVLDFPTAATIEPDMLIVDFRGEPATQRYVEIVDSQTRSRVVTTIELLSPTNKLPGSGRNLYLDKQDECLASGANLVEIDLTRRGDRLSVLPQLGKLFPPPTYVACVHSAAKRHRTAVYLLPLDRPLKPIRVPLRPTDEDVVLHLQPLVEQAYARGRYDRLDYTRPLDPPLAPDEAAFAERVLKQAGKR